MRLTEGQLREVLGRVVAPDLPVPLSEQLQRRARRRRMQQMGAVVAAVAVVTAGIVGGVSLTRNGSAGPTVQGSEFSVAQQHIGTSTYTALSYLDHGRPCISTSTGGHTCDAATWPTSVADYGSSTSNGVTEVSGRVPLDARKVTVNFFTHSVTVPAVLTPTSSTERSFAAFFVLPTAPSAQDSPFLGVVDAQGKPVAPVVSSPAPTSVTRGTTADGVTSYVVASDGQAWQAISTQRADSKWPCTAIKHGPQSTGGSCIYDNAPYADVLDSATLTDGRIVDIGGAPTGATSVRLVTSTADVSRPLVRVPTPGQRLLWAAVLPGAPSNTLLATCYAGDNCVTSTPID